MSEYIYIRRNTFYYDQFNICKLGRTTNIPERDNNYATGELKRGYFELVIELYKIKSSVIENILKNEFKKLNVVYNGGLEFFNIEIIDLIVPFLNKMNMEFKVLTKNEIDNLTRKNRLKTKLNKINKSDLITSLYKLSLINRGDFKINIVPNKIQSDVIGKINDYYENNDKGKVLWACGLGKALLSIMIVKECCFNKILIGVPTIFLQNQMLKEVLKIYNNIETILIVNGNSVNDPNIIKQFLNNETINPLFVITTYSSSHILKTDGIKFDFKIGDEAHHLAGIKQETNKSFLDFHKIESEKSLFLTGTEKIIDLKKDENVFSMDDEYVFGKTIDVKNVDWGIKNRLINDYTVIIDENINDWCEKIVKNTGIYDYLFKSALITIYNMIKRDGLTHILFYTNTCNNADKANNYINEILSNININVDKSEIYTNSIHSGDKKNIEYEIEKFKKSKLGIISCVYIFGEGFDLPKLNGVSFGEKMISTTRIIQSALRPNRLNIEDVNKKSYVLIPDLENKKKKCKQIIRELKKADRNVDKKVMNTSVRNTNVIYKQHICENIESKKIIIHMCNFCGYKTNYKNTLLRHIQRKNKCDTKNTYMNGDEIKEGLHYLSIDNKINNDYTILDNGRYKCSLCLKTCKYRNYIYTHIKNCKFKYNII